MSKLYYYMELHEVIVDNEWEPKETFEDYLPHHDIIAKEICKSWNEMNMEQYFDGVLKGNIQSAKMSCYRDKSNGKSMAKITIEGVHGFRFGSARRAEVFEQLDAQMSDGWGEGFFVSHVITAPDGTEFYVD